MRASIAHPISMEILPAAVLHAPLLVQKDAVAQITHFRSVSKEKPMLLVLLEDVLLLKDILHAHDLHQHSQAFSLTQIAILAANASVLLPFNCLILRLNVKSTQNHQ